MRQVALLIVLILLCGCTTATPTAAPPTATAVPPFARFTSADALATFRKFGLVRAIDIAAGPGFPFGDDAPVSPDQVRLVFYTRSIGFQGFIVTTTSQAQSDAAWNYLVLLRLTDLPEDHTSLLKNENLILALYWRDKPWDDIVLYQTAFIGMR
jgi:hypothetical protein